MTNTTGYQQTNIRFKLLKQLDEQGNFSEVFLAYDLQLNSNIIVKRIAKKDFSHYDDYYAESQNIYKSRHPNVAEIHYASDDQDYIYIAMPHYLNGSLNTLINKRFLTVREIIQFAINFLSGLNNIHTKGLIHFDIKPSNILLSDRNDALIADFGLTKYSDNFGFAKAGLQYGYHIPPEALKTSDFTIQYDIFQAGVTLYRMCNGNADFHKQAEALTSEEIFTKKISKGVFPNRKAYLAHIPNRLTTIINKMMHLDCDAKNGRYKTLINVLNDLSKIDSNLDWQYEKVSNSTELWKKDNKVITIKKEDADYIVKAMNNVSRILKYCQTYQNLDDAKSLVKAFIEEYD